MTSMMPEQAGQRRLGGSGGSMRAVVPSRLAATFERSTPSAVGEESEVADANQAAGQDVQQEAAQELIGGNGHDLLLAAVGIVPPAEGDAIVLEGHETMVGDGDAMGVAGQIVEHMFGPAEGWLGVDDPVLPEQAAGGSGECSQERPDAVVSRETEVCPAAKSCLQSSDELAAEDSAERLDGQEEAAARNRSSWSRLERGRRRERCSGHGDDAARFCPQVWSTPRNPMSGSEVLGIASQFEHGRGAGAEEQIVEQPLVLENKSGEFVRQSEDDMEVRNGQQFSRARGQPLGARVALALGAVPVAA